MNRTLNEKRETRNLQMRNEKRETRNVFRLTFFISLFMVLLLSFSALGQTYTNIYTRNDTSATTRDSINFGFDASQILIYNDATSSDTMFISTVSTFPASKTFRRVGATNFSHFINTNIIYVKFGTAATSGKKYRLEALR